MRLYINDFTDRFVQASNSGKRDAYAALLPEFFEKCQEFMEEIQRDVSLFALLLMSIQ